MVQCTDKCLGVTIISMFLRKSWIKPDINQALQGKSKYKKY